MGLELNPETAVPYLRQTGRLPAGTRAYTSPHGGRSNRVVKVEHGDDCLVLKQPRRQLADEAGTLADPDRIHREAAALRMLGRLARQCNAAVGVPEVRFEDHDSHIVGLACAPATATWRSDLLAGRVDLSVAGALGAFLATVHTAAADGDVSLSGNDQVTPTVDRIIATDDPAETTDDKNTPVVSGNALQAQAPESDIFEQFRIQRYHRPVAAAHPDLTATVETEIRRIRSAVTTLLHGDYNPKNVLVARGGRPRCWVFDAEFACWGDPAWDVASTLAHVYIPAMHIREDHEAYMAAARRFWQTYQERIPWALEQAVVTETAILLLARIDGEATLSYLSDSTADILRNVGRGCLNDEVESVDALQERVQVALE